ncbi:lipase family protein [Cronobacter dublinensis]|uniref:lipase family protein n=1 Tax=Cronobacter dublinensis TaxID=413497 RepID=UPI000CFF4AE5|nr:lipase family protein [Cronobacter dublinensis]
MVAAISSGKRKYPNSPSGEHLPYWIEIKLVDEQGDPVANMPWKAESHHPVHGKDETLTYSNKSGIDGTIRIDMPHGLELVFTIETMSLLNEMEKRRLRVGRDAQKDSIVRLTAEENGSRWHYAVVGELCQESPALKLNQGERLPLFHFPVQTSFKGIRFLTSDLEKHHVIEICPFRAWELLLHHQNEYSMANAINLGTAASLAYFDDSTLDVASITRFFMNQCQDLSRLPQLHKDGKLYNTLVQDIPYSDRYNPPIFMDTSKETKEKSDVQVDEDGDTQLYYVYNTDKVIISWRGTASLFDVGTDLTYRPVDTSFCYDSKATCPTISLSGKVHEGFWNGYCRAEEKYRAQMATLEQLATSLKLFICGHSLGGALALIHAAKLKNINPILYTYGMPRTFTKKAVDDLPSIPHFRHVNDNDPVPAVPFEADLDNELYNLYGPLGTIFGGTWSILELSATKIKSWGDCFWHHGNLVAFLTATQTKQWKECKQTLPQESGCISIRKSLPIKAKLYLVPALAEQESDDASEKQKEFTQSLSKTLSPKKINEFFSQGANPERGVDITFGDHFMGAYMPYLNNNLLGLIDKTGLARPRSFTEHESSVNLFKEQMEKYKDEIPEVEYERNEIFLSLDHLLSKALKPTLQTENGSDFLKRFAQYGDEDIENV